MDKKDKKRGEYITESSRRFLFPILFILILLIVVVLSIQLYERGAVGKAFIIQGEAAIESGKFVVIPSSTNIPISTERGEPFMYSVPADYDGDGKADYGWWDWQTGEWIIYLSSNDYAEPSSNYPKWGGAGDFPIPDDYDLDRRADLAVLRSDGVISVFTSKGQMFNSEARNRGWNPATGDYNGDGITDFGWFDPALQKWKIWESNLVSRGCETDADCANFCQGNIFKSGGLCSYCDCSYSSTVDCDSFDGNYDTGITRWADETMCTKKQQVQKEYREYSCSREGCAYIVTRTFYEDSSPLVTAPKDEGTQCNDGLFCTENDRCTSGVCTGTSKSCSDSISCSEDLCNEETDLCIHALNNSRCDDGISCSAGICDLANDCQYSYDSCPCTSNTQCSILDDECNFGICGAEYSCIKSPKPNGGSCGANDFCRVNNVCINGACSGAVNPCSAQDKNINECTYNPDGISITFDKYLFDSMCDEGNNLCPAAPAEWENLIIHSCNKTCGAECETDDDCPDKCVGKSFYSNGRCDGCSCSYDIETCPSDNWYNIVGVQWIDETICTEQLQRKQEFREYSCNAAEGCVYENPGGAQKWINITGAVRNKNDGTACNDNIFCTENDRCTSGVCAGTSKICNDDIACTTDSCSEANQMCVYTTNNNLCADGISCSTVSCSAQNGCVYEFSGCDCNSDSECNGDQCNNGRCNMITHSCYLEPANEGDGCDDGLFCTVNEKCSLGICKNGISKDCSGDDKNVNECDYAFDGNNLTLDYYSFTSLCNEDEDKCTSAGLWENNITHTCNIEECNAECEIDDGCEKTVCSNQSRCVGRDYYYYADVKNTCSSCLCSKNLCNAPLIMPEDPRCSQTCLDKDGDGFTDKACRGRDCNDLAISINPDAAEMQNGIDDNCNMLIDEGFSNFCSAEDGPRECGITDIGECSFGVQTCSLGTWSLCAGSINPVYEICDGKDNDCDGTADDSLTKPLAEKQSGVCAGARKICNGTDGWNDDYSYISGYEADETTCDKADNDCDGKIDEGCCGNMECEAHEDYAKCPEDCYCVFEWACIDRNKVGAKNIDCSIDIHDDINSRFGLKKCMSECADEKCIDTGQPAVCFDSDYGANLDIKGTAVLTEKGVETKIEDYCMAQSNYAVEARCGMSLGKPIIYTEMKNCGDREKCYDGICIDINLICADDDDCEDSNECTDDTCINGICAFSNDNSNLCNDDLFCTTNDRCANGVCIGDSRICNDGFSCTADSCNEATNLCVNERTNCTCLINSECNDNNPCTDDICANQSCVFTNDNTNNCSGMWCLTNNTCRNGVCAGNAKNCTDNLYYTADSCDEEEDECVHRSILPIITGFSQSLTTNVSDEDNISEVEDFSIGITGKARIQFIDEEVDLAELNLARDVLIKKAYVQVKGESLSRFKNKTATITMYNITFKEPKILKNNKLCNDCEEEEYKNNNLVFTAELSGIYTAAEGFEECKEDWTCTSYLPQECPSTGIQRRNCEDKNKCGTMTNMPEEERRCRYTEPVPEGNCYDEIKNQHETGIDCGGECPACPDQEKPEPTKSHFWVYVSAIFMVSSILAAVGIIAYEQKKKAKLDEYTKRLKDYIQRSLSQGYKMEQIERQLMSEGWQKEIIEDIFNGKNKF